MVREIVRPSSPQFQDYLWAAGNVYIHAGLGLVALHGKTPHPAHNPHSFKSPITTYPEWEAAARDQSVTGVGIVCTAHRWVLDIDGPEGWQALFARGVFPLSVPTAVSITSRGAHFWFETEAPVKSRGQGPSFLPHVDLKASGYVAAPPSIHPETGLAYRWAEGPLVLGGMAVAASPPLALVEFLDSLSFAETALGPSPYADQSRGDISHLAAHLRRSPQGERNGTLNWCALRAGVSGFSLVETLTALVPVALDIGLTARESRATVKSGWKAGNGQRQV